MHGIHKGAEGGEVCVHEFLKLDHGLQQHSKDGLQVLASLVFGGTDREILGLSHEAVLHVGPLLLRAFALEHHNEEERKDSKVGTHEDGRDEGLLVTPRGVKPSSTPN